MYIGIYIYVEIQVNNESIRSKMSVVCDEFCKIFILELIFKYFFSVKILYIYCGII